jgi:2-dehydropantoate 2-reductase
MRHAILGAGGIGGLVAAALARGSSDVVILLRPEALAKYDGSLVVDSAVLGQFTIDVPAMSKLDRAVDVLWVTTKATQLEPALALAPPERVGDATVIPLLNGIDHVELLRQRYRSVVPGVIRVESERLAPGRISQTSPFLSIGLAGAEPVAGELRMAGVDCSTSDDELTLLWSKLAFLAPVALATTAVDGPLGAIRDDERYHGCQSEVLAVARAEGAQVDEQSLRSMAAGAPYAMRSSMQKDVAAGRQPELDAIAGPVLRGAARHDIAVPYTEELARLVASRAGGR